MTTRDVGDRINVRYTALDANGEPITATVVLTVTDPTGDTSTPTVTHTAPNLYDASFTLSEAGTWQWKWTVSGNVVDVDYGEVYAADPAPQTYSSLASMRKQANIPPSETSLDELLQVALDAASRDIETHCDGRVFWLARAATARVFSTRHTLCNADGYRLPLFDGSVNCIGSATITVEVGDGTTWTAVTSYETWPDNALAKGEAIEALVSQTDWRNWRKARVTTRWGWPAVPAKVHQATTLHGARFLRRKDSPEGVAGSSEWGLVRVPFMDPDVRRLLAEWHTEFQAR